MNEDQIHEALRAIAHREIPDTMDRWSEIRAQVRPHKRGLLRWNLTRLAVVFAVLILALLTIAVGYAVFFHWWDPGMQSVEKAGLITPVQITALPTVYATTTQSGAAPTGTKTGTPVATAQSGDVVATLNSVYADAQRVAITYTIRNLPPAEPGKRPYLLDVNISYADGSLFNAASGGGADPGAEPGTLVGQETFEHHEPVPADGSVDVLFTIKVTRLDASQPNAMPELLYTFTFPVTLHVSRGTDIDIEQTQTVTGIAVTLKTVTITSSATQAVLCYDLPPGSFDWSPDTQIMIDGAQGIELGWGIVGSKQDANVSPRCLRMSYSTPYKPGAKHLTLTVTRLRTESPEVPSQQVLDRARERLAAQGIEVVFKQGDHAFGWDIVRAPAGMDEATVGKAVMDALSEQVNGPWVFEVELPAQ